MSGIDEQYSDVCPRCNTMPSYWALGSTAFGGLVWLYTEKYLITKMKDSIGFTIFDGVKSVGEVESKIDYVRCSKCLHRFEDMMFIKSKIVRAKKLEEKGRVGLA